MAKSPITQESIIKKFRDSDVSEIYQFKKRSDQILWVLKTIKKDFKIDDYIADSVLVDILVESLEISCNIKSVNNSLNPIRTKIHKKVVENEIYYKIMHDGILHIEKILGKSSKSNKKQDKKSETFDSPKSIKAAIAQVKKMGVDRRLKPGLYYIVMMDLVGSSIASSQINPEDNKKRVRQFIAITKNALPKRPKNYLTFVKDFGDASLFLFSNFEDILNWANKVDSLCNEYNLKCIKKGKPDIFQMYSTKCVHLGEVLFSYDSDPIALAINQISKIAKKFKKDQLGITDVVKQVILPRINSNQLTAKKLKKIILPGETASRPLWVIGYNT